MVNDQPLQQYLKSWQTKIEGTQQKDKSLLSAGARALNVAIRNALNKIAYDTATWIGSGGKGQKPLFYTEGWDTYLSNIADEAGGDFISQLGQNNGFLKFNLCEPNLNVKLAISSGLVAQMRPQAPTCNWSTMQKNWATEADKLSSMKAADFLQTFQGNFDPAQNDLGVALSVQTGMMEQQNVKATAATQNRQETGGWLNVTNVAGYTQGIPNAAQRAEAQAEMLQESTLGTWTGDALTDAANVFLNQLAITAFNNLMQHLGDNSSSITTTSSCLDNGTCLTDSTADATTGGVAGLQQQLGEIITPNFTIRADYNILGDLAICPDPTKAGPTNCVITDKFSQGITEKKTVAEAIQLGYLNKNGVFGFNVDGTELKYADESYPYRSMVILRKYRIIPVGWEVAAQYIKANASTTVKNYTLGDMVACFDPNDEYTGLDETWCHGLVDPNWVLKAPLNYCRRQGYGPEITSENVSGEGDSSSLTISRNNNYCGDEQSCINENDDGSCSAYGYCVKDKRIWDFNSKSCDANYNTCQTFKSDSGKTVSYLENTLDYSGCSASNAGCKAYALNYDYATQQWQAAGAKIYLDNNADKCDSKNEGCHEFIRTKDSTGANLIQNSSFESSLTGTFGESLGTTVSDAYDGQLSLQLSGPVNKSIAVGAADYAVGGDRFTLSFYAKNCGTAGTFGINNVTNPLSTSPDTWSREVMTYVYPANTAGNNALININPVGSSCLIDAIKLERGAQATAYSDYHTDGLIYEKVLPDYLASGNICYDASGNVASSAPAVCSNFVRKCTAAEAGCELYTGTTDGMSIPAKAVAQDYCPGECVGYDTYVQSETTFDSQRSAYFIPSTAKTCDAASAGCEEFTNLDKVAQGGEGLEYYSYLKQCIKPDNTCGSFYTWEGSDETGYQLKVVSLKQNGSQPAVTSSDSALCSAAIYSLPSTDPSYNADCRQFYDQAGNISYHLMSYTVTCSDNCQGYRMTRINTDSTGATACLNGGVWDATHNGCIYMAVPGEGTSCSAQNNGCREYGGNTGNNMKIIVNNDFEGSTQGWTGISGTTVSTSNNALLVGGRSLSVSGGSNSASITIGNSVSVGKSYVLSFLAEGTGSLTAVISDSAASSTSFNGSAALSATEWSKFTLNIASLSAAVTSAEILQITGSGSFYLDDLRLTEITDRYYLIRDSWVTPASCDEDQDGNPSPLFALGCEAYTDRSQQTSFLHSFSHLCQESAVGCEMMIDTANSANYGAETASSVNPTVTTPADNYTYVVFDQKKQCSVADKGCQRLGSPYDYDGATVYTDVYLKNDPDKYSTSLCDAAAAKCSSWTTSDGTSYFKDPSDQACEWRQKKNQGSGTNSYAWLEKQIKRCGGLHTESICLTDSDCKNNAATSTQTCSTDATDVSCPVNGLLTFGAGGYQVNQPTTGWAGICPAAQSGCTEYIDPASKFSTDLVVSSSTSLSPDELYVLSGGGATLSGCKDSKTSAAFSKLYSLSSNNTLGASAASISNPGTSIRFYVGDNTTKNNITCTVSAGGAVRQAVVDYQLQDNIDAKTCNGMVDFEKGCVLFDERTQDGGNGLVNLSSYYDTDLTTNDGNGIAPISNSNTAYNNANKIIKVSPDRKCGEWLACENTQTDSSGDGVCMTIGVCNKFNDNGGCDRFIRDANSKPVDQSYDPSSAINSSYISNMTGYVKVGHSALGGYPSLISTYPNDYYQLEAASSTGFSANVPNWGFEDAVSVLYNSSTSTTHYIPGNLYELGSGWTCQNDDYCNVINNPYRIQKMGACLVGDTESCTTYAPEGRNFLDLTEDPSIGSIMDASTSQGQEITVTANADYSLTAYMDTVMLINGKAAVYVEEYGVSGSDSSGNLTSYVTKSAYKVLSLDIAQPWTFKIGKFHTDPATRNIKIILTAENNPNGDIYFDDVEIKSTLASRDNWNTPQTCRIYPKEDSLTCDYYESSGIRQKGWSGYCLEYDRAPGDPNACLLWWPIPNNSYKSDSICGDGYANGTTEQCDCTPPKGSLLATSSCNAMDGVTNSNPAYVYFPYGTNNLNQYACTQTCNWTDAYCGDGTIQNTYFEHCDFAGGTAGLRNMTCWSADHNTTITGANNATETIDQDFIHGNGYDDYLYGTLGCYDNSVSKDYQNPKQHRTKNCTFNAAGTCSDNLYYDGTNSVHTRADCINAGGVVVADDDGTPVTNSDGSLISGRAGNGKNYFCEFPVSIPGGANNQPTPSCQGHSGWSVYYSSGGSIPWTTTSISSCTGNACDAGNGGVCGWPKKNATCVTSHNTSQTSTSHSTFSDTITTESQSYADGSSCDCASCWSGSSACWATISAIGCY